MPSPARERDDLTTAKPPTIDFLRSRPTSEATRSQAPLGAPFNVLQVVGTRAGFCGLHRRDPPTHVHEPPRPVRGLGRCTALVVHVRSLLVCANPKPRGVRAGREEPAVPGWSAVLHATRVKVDGEAPLAGDVCVAGAGADTADGLLGQEPVAEGSVGLVDSDSGCRLLAPGEERVGGHYDVGRGGIEEVCRPGTAVDQGQPARPPEGEVPLAAPGRPVGAAAVDFRWELDRVVLDTVGAKPTTATAPVEEMRKTRCLCASTATATGVAGSSVKARSSWDRGSDVVGGKREVAATARPAEKNDHAVRGARRDARRDVGVAAYHGSDAAPEDRAWLEALALDEDDRPSHAPCDIPVPQ